jgi:hypothetical protein
MTLERVRAVLGELGPLPTPLELAEVLWLAGYLPAGRQGGESASGGVTEWHPEVSERPGPNPGESAADPVGSAASSPPDAQARGPDGEPHRSVTSADREPGWRDMPAEQDVAQARSAAAGESRAPLYVPGGPPGTGSDAGPVLLTAPAILTNALAVQRALRPLKRRVPSRVDVALDEDATAGQIAEDLYHSRLDGSAPERPWRLALKPASERWLGLSIVVDAGPAMDVWNPLFWELREAMFRLGAFRDVRIWFVADQHGRIGIRAADDSPVLVPESLIDPTGRLAVFVLSDCSGPHWWDGRMGPVIHRWARYGPTAILQPLAVRLWHRTAAPVDRGLAILPRPGAPNTQLDFVPYDGSGLPRSDHVPAVPVPVVAATQPAWLADWAKMVAGTGGARDMAVTWLPDEVVALSEPVAEERAHTIRERVLRFHAAASPGAFELAAHVAVAVPTLPVMRLIQQEILRRPYPDELSEMLLSGLLGADGKVQGSYEFVPGARAALLESLTRKQSLATAATLQGLSERVRRSQDGVLKKSFTMAIPVPAGTGEYALSEARGPDFVSQEALRILNPAALDGLREPARELAVPVRSVAVPGVAVPGRRDAVTLRLEITVPPESWALPTPDPAAWPLRRDAAVAAVLGALAPAQGSRKPGAAEIAGPGRAVVGISGPPEVGKTAVAVAAARAARESGWFPGGVLYAGLRTFVDAAGVLKDLLRALAIPADFIPDNTGERARLYARVLAAYAEQGRRLLVVLDEVADNSETVSLFTGGGAAAAIVVARVAMDLRGVRQVRLGLGAPRGPDTPLTQLPERLRHELESVFPASRAGAVRNLARWAALDRRQTGPRRAEAAQQMLRELVATDIPEVAGPAGDELARLEAEFARPMAPAALTSISEPGVVILGANNSGKTMLTSAFNVAMIRQRTGFTLVADDAASEQLLIDMTWALTDLGEVPPATEGIDILNWSLYGRARRTPPTGEIVSEPVRVRLNMVEPSGEIVQSDRLGFPLRRDLIGHLAKTPGIIFTFDPVRESERGKQFQSMNNMLVSLARAAAANDPDFDGRLRHHLAVCVTKFDEPRVLIAAGALGLLTSDQQDPRGFPRVRGDGARTLFRALSANHPNSADEMLVDLLERYFLPERIRYFVTTATGFHIDPRTGKFDPDDPVNIYRNAAGVTRIKGPIYPINVAEPLMWAIQRDPVT